MLSVGWLLFIGWQAPPILRSKPPPRRGKVGEKRPFPLYLTATTLSSLQPQSAAFGQFDERANLYRGSGDHRQ